MFLGNVVIFTLLRVVFLLAFSDHRLPTGDLLNAFYLGLKFDARLAAIISLPLLFVSSTIYIVAAEVLVAMIYAADFGTYAYIHQRLNASAFEFLRNPIISWHMIWESYHVVWFALGIVAVIGAMVLLIRRRPATGDLPV